MNRYMVDGVLADARAGRRVIVVCGTRREARAALEDVAQHLMPGTERAYRANGQERIVSTGVISFLPPTDCLRGQTADVVVVPQGRIVADRIDENLRILRAAGAEVIL